MTDYISDPLVCILSYNLNISGRIVRKTILKKIVGDTDRLISLSFQFIFYYFSFFVKISDISVISENFQLKEIKLVNKVAWITGGGAGIGEASAIKLSEEGFIVVLSGRTK